MYIITYKVYIYALQSFHDGAGGLGGGGSPLGLGACYPPCQFISNMVNHSLYVVETHSKVQVSYA